MYEIYVFPRYGCQKNILHEENGRKQRASCVVSELSDVIHTNKELKELTNEIIQFYKIKE